MSTKENKAAAEYAQKLKDMIKDKHRGLQVFAVKSEEKREEAKTEGEESEDEGLLREHSFNYYEFRELLVRSAFVAIGDIQQAMETVPDESKQAMLDSFFIQVTLGLIQTVKENKKHGGYHTPFNPDERTLLGKAKELIDKEKSELREEDTDKKEVVN